jgi:hypothetical protein
VREIAEELRLTYTALRYRMSQYCISVRASYSRISSVELNSLVRQIVTENNALGEVYVRS